MLRIPGENSGVKHKTQLAVTIASFILACCARQRAGAETYVVDQAAPGAADLNRGTEDSPFKTVQHGGGIRTARKTLLTLRTVPGKVRR